MQDRDNIIATLEEVCAHEIFVASPTSIKFLRHLVNKSLEGSSDQLNETAIAQDLFGKGGDFDPYRDSVVRVTARRVRNLLAKYNAKEVSKTGLVISIPKGRYYPVFEKPDVDVLQSEPDKTASSKEPRHTLFQTRRVLPFLALGAVIVFASLYFLRSNDDAQNVAQFQKPEPPALSEDDISKIISTYPRIAVAPFDNISGDDRYDFLELALQKRLVNDLARYKIVRPSEYSYPIEVGLSAKNRPYQYMVSGQIINVSPELDLNVKFIDVENAKKFYEKRIRRQLDGSEYYDVLTKIVSELSADLAGSQSTISLDRLNKIEAEIKKDSAHLSDIRGLECITLADRVVSYPGPEVYKNAYQCLENLLEKDPDNPTLLAYFASITYAGAVAYEGVFKARDVNPNINVEDAVDMMERSIEIDPENGYAFTVISVFHKYNGDLKAAREYAELAYVTFPGDPEIINILSAQLAADGEWDRATQLAYEAIERTAEPQPDYYHPLFLEALWRDDKEALQTWSEKLTELGHFYADTFSFMTAVETGNKAVMDDLRPRMFHYATRRPDNHKRMVKWTALDGNDDLVERVRETFVKGGIITPTGKVAEHIVKQPE